VRHGLTLLHTSEQAQHHRWIRVAMPAEHKLEKALEKAFIYQG
jgi:hypothetical protein